MFYSGTKIHPHRAQASSWYLVPRFLIFENLGTKYQDFAILKNLGTRYQELEIKNLGNTKCNQF